MQINRKVIKIHVEQDYEDENLHTCPYAEDIYGDSETLCVSDEERTYQCAMDI